MSDIVIRVENLSKQYKIGVKRHDRLTDALTDRLNALFRRPRSPVSRPPSSDGPNPQSEIQNPQSDHIWALKDVSFEVKQGDVLGIIGRNGAGKSTLLKILSRITEPTTGRAEIYSRVGSLLEVGTGFHPELTGRENIYLNGAVLGMGRVEIARKFDEIVDFSGVEKFIDTPVKRYSSGMYVRLAFAVAAHLEPEILIVDEVLAVGDAAFQKKCLGKIESVAKEGRTVLFVSHNMGAVETLCTRGVVLEIGKIVFDGPAGHAVSRYLSRNQAPAGNSFANCARSGSGRIRITDVHLENEAGDEVVSVRSGDSLVVVIEFEADKEGVSAVSPGVGFLTENERPLFVHYSHISGLYFDRVAESGCFKCVIPDIPLAPGNYLIGMRILAGGDEVDWPKVLVPFTVEAGAFYGTSTVETQFASWGPFLVRPIWLCEVEDTGDRSAVGSARGRLRRAGGTVARSDGAVQGGEDTGPPAHG